MLSANKGTHTLKYSQMCTHTPVHTHKHTYTHSIVIDQHMLILN